MAITYNEALQIIRTAAEQCSTDRGVVEESVPLHKALGRCATRNHVSLITTPVHDSSAMDGYAVPSEATTHASDDHPIIFRVEGTIAAGDNPIELANDVKDGAFSCAEIMTGALFPVSSSGKPFDACVKIEDTVLLGPSFTTPGYKEYKRIAVTRPVPHASNRRSAGEDFKQGDVILHQGEIVHPRHVMALASVGVFEVTVHRQFRVAVWSTGNELSEGPDSLCSDSQIFNSNGPFLVSALQEFGIDANYRGILRDEPVNLKTALKPVGAELYDLVLTTGAVSKGKFDFIVPALEELQAKIHFHGVAMRPGHPVLFATMISDRSTVPIFALPGNPIATAACFQFLVMPFLGHTLGRPIQRPEIARLLIEKTSRDSARASPTHLDYFRHGVIYNGDQGFKHVVLSKSQSPAIISQFAASTCWVHIPRGFSTTLDPMEVDCYMHGPSFV